VFVRANDLLLSEHFGIPEASGLLHYSKYYSISVGATET